MTRETTALTVIVLLLVTCGVLMVYSATGFGGDGTGALKRQIACAVLGLGAFFFCARFDYHGFGGKKLFWIIQGVSILFLILVLLPYFSEEVNGARRWFKIGPFQFQPSECAKFALVVWLAGNLTVMRMHLNRFWFGFLPPIAVTGLYATLVFLENDLGLPAVLMAVALLVMWNAGVNPVYLALTGAAGIGGVLYIAYTTPHRIERMLAFRDPAAHRDDASYQLVQSLRGFAEGGAWGQGLGAGEQKLDYLFAAHTDFIFSVIGEERGLAGTLLIVLLFAALTFVSFRIAHRAPDMFGALLASGCAVLIAFQAAFIMAVTIGLAPTKGMPLPFISHGGTALIVFLACAGVLVNVGAQVRVEEREGRSIMPAQQPAHA
ncbi:MAG TPA: putative peptidoglycan glycosyltransferase FtsW [Candidatus Hydrogenedentes bacterium]|nr:putative peptidoglycan glycosyltransferase FtsW [Candidatus Hydrogenedentota bacterium]HNT88778.1 putative peptidoglycan glycosyltransferase FtsW [Candidatus Hydrogenedentota bacterium]